jgi:hypothetical protein
MSYSQQRVPPSKQTQEQRPLQRDTNISLAKRAESLIGKAESIVNQQRESSSQNSAEYKLRNSRNAD